MSDDRRTLILDAAIRLLEREGPKAFKQTRVAAEAELEQGHLTYYFPRKIDLVAGVLEHFTLRSREEIVRGLAGASGDAAQVLLAFARALAKDHHRTRLMLGLILESQAEPEHAEKVAELVRFQRRAFAMVIGRAEGDLDAELALAALRGIGVEHMMLGGNGSRVDALVERLAEWLDQSKARGEKKPP